MMSGGLDVARRLRELLSKEYELIPPQRCDVLIRIGAASGLHRDLEVYRLKGGGVRLRYHGVSTWTQGAEGASASAQEKAMSWDEERVRRGLEHYETQSDEEAVADDPHGNGGSRRARSRNS